MSTLPTLTRAVLPLILSGAFLAACDSSSGSGGSPTSTGDSTGTSTGTSGVGTAASCWTELPKATIERVVGLTYTDSTSAVGPSSRLCRRSGKTPGHFAQWIWTPGTSMMDARKAAHDAAVIRTLSNGSTCAHMGGDSSSIYFLAKTVTVRGRTALHIGSANSSCTATGLTRELLGSCGSRSVNVMLMGDTSVDSLAWARTDSVFASVCSP